MNLVYGEVVELFLENGIRMGMVRVAGALKKAPFELVTDVECGDRVLLCDGVAISKVREMTKPEGPGPKQTVPP
jgi:hydrogenase maturation factor